MDSEDSALGERFEDSDDEVGLNDKVILNHLNNTNVDSEIHDGVEVGAGSEQQKNKGGRPKKNNNAYVPKKRKGRPTKSTTIAPTDEIQFDEEEEASDPDSFNLRELKRGKLMSEIDEEYDSEVLETDVDSEGDEVPKIGYLSFVMPKKMLDYKWILGSKFSSKEEFKEAVTIYSIHNGYDIKYAKNDKIRVRVVCQDGCEWFAYCAKLPNEDTWQLRTLNDNHHCKKEYKVRMMNSTWLGKKLVPTVSENPTISLETISNRAHKKWHTGVSRMKAYRAKRIAIDLVDGNFKEQFHRLHDYCHEILRSNPNSTTTLTVQHVEIVEGIIVEDFVDRPLLPTFQRLYMCLDGCKKSFLKCRRIIGLDGCFLKGYYGGQLLAAVGRDPNDQMLPIALAVVEGILIYL